MLKSYLSRSSITAGILVISIVLMVSTVAQAQSEKVEAKFTGITGGAIAGFELVVFTEAIFGVKKTWPYLTFPFLGSIGGAIGGHFIEKKSPKASLTILFISMAMIIPSALAAAAATSYDPSEEEYTKEIDQGNDKKYSFEMPVTEIDSKKLSETKTEVQSKPSSPPPAGSAPAGTDSKSGGSSFLNFTKDGKFAFSFPNINLYHSVRTKEDIVMGSKSKMEIYISLLSIEIP